MAVTAADFLVGEQVSVLGQVAQNRGDFVTKVDQCQTAGFLAARFVVPVTVIRLSARNVGLRTAKMPAQLIEVTTLGSFSRDDQAMPGKRDGSLGWNFTAGHSRLGNDGPRQPPHREAEVVELPQMDIGADRFRL